MEIWNSGNRITLNYQSNPEFGQFLPYRSEKHKTGKNCAWYLSTFFVISQKNQASLLGPLK